jgi:hypothetical protein
MAPAPRRFAALVAAACAIITLSTPLVAQWLKYPTAGVPRTAAGKVNMTAPAPRTAAGTPDFSGLWVTANPWCPAGYDPNSGLCGLELPMGLWIDWNGSEIGESAKVRERIRRPEYGHLEIEVTVDDPKAYTKPWTVKLRQSRRH